MEAAAAFGSWHCLLGVCEHIAAPTLDGSSPVAVINIIGVFVLFVGLFVTIPVTLMASAYVYRRLSPAEEAAGETAAEPA